MKIGINNGVVNYNMLSLDKLVEHISETYHSYLKELITSLGIHLKTMRKISNNQPEVAPISDCVQELKVLLEQHESMEEQVLFPYINNLIKNPEYLTSPPDNRSENLIIKIKKDHARFLGILDKIRKLSDNYSPAVNSSSALKLCYAQLFNLEQDIHKHVFVEENILFPKLREFEKKKIKSIKK